LLRAQKKKRTATKRKIRCGPEYETQTSHRITAIMGD
jgi:hypothetical protein